MIRKNISRFVPIILILVMVLSAISAFAANIAVPITRDFGSFLFR